MADQQFTLHRRAWRLFLALPRLVRIYLVLALIAALIKFVFLSGSDAAQPVREAVIAAVHEALGPDPGSSCSALSPAGLSEVVTTFGSGPIIGGSAELLAQCRQLVGRLRTEATPQQLADFAGGNVRAVQFRADGSALVIYLAADGKLGAELTMSRHSGRWLIDGLAGGAVAGAG